MRAGLGFVVPHLASSFDPTSISGLVGWWDASDTATITSSGGLVSQWDDKSGTGNHATAGTGSAQPTTGTRTQNSLNVLDFDGSSDYMVSNLTSSSRTETVFAVVLGDVLGGDNNIVGCAGGTGGRNLQCRSGNLWSYGKSWFSVDAQYSGAASTATPYIVMSASSATNVIWAVNGSADETDSTSVTLTAGRTSTIGVDAGNGLFGFWNGWIAEIVVYDSQLGSTDRASVRDYLNTKWAVY